MFFLTHRIIFPQLVRLEINMKLNFHEKLPGDDEATISKVLSLLLLLMLLLLLLLLRYSLLEFEISVQVQTDEFEI